jgi:CIC family chloride channel protein
VEWRYAPTGPTPSDERDWLGKKLQAAWWVVAFGPPSVGVISGFGPEVFRALIGGFPNLLLLVRWSFDYDAMAPLAMAGSSSCPSSVLSGLLPGRALLHSRPRLRRVRSIGSDLLKQSRIRPIVAILKSFVSALPIGSGASVERERPIVDLAATFGSALGR